MNGNESTWVCDLDLYAKEHLQSTEMYVAKRKIK